MSGFCLWLSAPSVCLRLHYDSLYVIILGCEANGKTALDYHKRACDGGHPVGCYQAGLLRLTGMYGVKADNEEAQEFLRKGCDKDDSESCYHLSSLYLNQNSSGPTKQTAGNLEKANQNAFKYSKKACDLNHIYACANLYQLYKRGLGCQQDIELAEQAKKKAIAIKDAYERKEEGIVFGQG